MGKGEAKRGEARRRVSQRASEQMSKRATERVEVCVVERRQEEGRGYLESTWRR